MSKLHRGDVDSPRQRLTGRITGSKLRLEVKRSARPLLVLLIGALITIGCGGYILNHIGGGFGDTREVRFAVSDATGLVADRGEVRFRGIPAGNVGKIERYGDVTAVSATISNEFGPIYRDATAEVRPNTPLQDMYLNIVSRGTEQAGELHGEEPLPVSQTSTSVNVADVLDVFSTGTRARVATLLDQLGVGLDDQGANLRWGLNELSGFVNVVGRLSAQIDVRKQKTRRLIAGAGKLTEILARRETELRRLLKEGSEVLSATATERASLDATLRELDPAVRTLSSSLAAVRHVLPDVDEAVTKLGPVAGNLKPGLAAIEQTAAAAAPAVKELREPLNRLVPLSRALQPVARKLSSSISRLQPQVPAYDYATKSVAACPMAMYQFFQFTASLTKTEDAFGVYPRGDFGFAADTVSGVKDPFVRVNPSCQPGRTLGAEPNTVIGYKP